jgi:hypothetical protein
VVLDRPRAGRMQVRLDAAPLGERFGDVGSGSHLADRPFHLQLDEPVQLQRVLHGQLAGNGLD